MAIDLDDGEGGAYGGEEEDEDEEDDEDYVGPENDDDGDDDDDDSGDANSEAGMTMRAMVMQPETAKRYLQHVYIVTLPYRYPLLTQISHLLCHYSEPKKEE